MKQGALFGTKRPQKLWRCTCGHLNAEHDKRRGQGPWRCGHVDCGCMAFDWDGSPEIEP